MIASVMLLELYWNKGGTESQGPARVEQHEQQRWSTEFPL